MIWSFLDSKLICSVFLDFKCLACTFHWCIIAEVHLFPTYGFKSLHIKRYLWAYLDVMINWFISYCFNILIYIGLLPINNIVIVSGGQQRDSTNTYMWIHSRSNTPHIHGAQSIGQSSLCYTVGPCWLSILNTAVCTWPSRTPWLSLLPILCPCFFFLFLVKSQIGYLFLVFSELLKCSCTLWN